MREITAAYSFTAQYNIGSAIDTYMYQDCTCLLEVICCLIS